MRIFIINTYYSGFLDYFYKKSTGIENQSYEKHWRLLMDEKFGTSDFSSVNFNNLGHEAKEFIVNDEILQKKWAKENNIKYTKSYFQNIPKLRSIFKSDWLEKIMEAQIEKYDPDVIYSHNLNVLSPDLMNKIKIGKNNKKRLLVGQIACPLPEDKFLTCHDIIITSFPHFVPYFKNIGIKSYYVKLGFEETVLKSISDNPIENDAVFIGTLGSKHEMGTNLLEELSNKTKIKIWGRGIEKIKNDSPLRSVFQGEAWGRDMYQILHDSKISINRHIDVAGSYANNLRLYESTGVGCMLLTDEKENIGDIFIVGEEIVTYKNIDDLISKINYYLTHEEERKGIARRGQLRTLKDHTYKQRIVEIIDILKQNI